jgi:hypothetical protein
MGNSSGCAKWSVTPSMIVVRKEVGLSVFITPLESEVLARPARNPRL